MCPRRLYTFFSFLICSYILYFSPSYTRVCQMFFLPFYYVSIDVCVLCRCVGASWLFLLFLDILIAILPEIYFCSIPSSGAWPDYLIICRNEAVVPTFFSFSTSAFLHSLSLSSIPTFFIFLYIKNRKLHEKKSIFYIILYFKLRLGSWNFVRMSFFPFNFKSIDVCLLLSKVLRNREKITKITELLGNIVFSIWRRMLDYLPIDEQETRSKLNVLLWRMLWNQRNVSNEINLREDGNKNDVYI